MNKSQPYKLCHCGFTFPSELDLYKKSIPVGLQRTGLKHKFDLELRICPKCRSTFAIKTMKDLDPRWLSNEG